MSRRGRTLLTLVLIALPARLAAPQAARSFSISGDVTDSVTGAPVPHAHLTAGLGRRRCTNDEISAPETESDADGRFTLRIPCAGAWRLSAEAQSFAAQAFEQHDSFSTRVVLTTSQPSFELTFRMVPNSSISGLVLDEAAEPVRDAKVTLLSNAMEGLGPESVHPVSSTTTDDRGFYEFASLLPGAYQLAVQARPWYAAAANPGRFGVAPAPPPANSQDPSLDMAYPLTFYPGTTESRTAATLRLVAGTVQQADFHLSPIPSVHLLIPASARFGSPPEPGAPIGRRGFNLPPIEQISELGDSDFRPTSMSIAQDGSMDIGGLAPGTYALTPRGGDRMGRESERLVVDIREGSPHMVELGAASSTATSEDQTSAAQTRLNGTVTLAGKPDQGAMLLLVPSTLGQKDTQARLRRQQSNTDGSFSFDRVPTGKYILAAIDHGWTIDWHDPMTLNRFLLHGIPINLQAATTLKKPVEAQTP